jgi:hypothetical protein
MLLLLYCLPLLVMVWQRSGSCCGCYIVYNYCFRFDRGVVHVVVVILSTITTQGMTEELLMLLLLYCLPLLLKVWQRSGSCCGCYIVYHYCLRFDKGVVHVVVVVLSTITVKGLRGKWFMWLLLYCLPLLFKVWQRSGFHVVAVILSTITVYGLTEEWFMLLLLCFLPLLFKVWQRSGSCCCCYIVYHYYLRYDREVVHVVVILSTITV